jgi:monoamine oxidase
VEHVLRTLDQMADTVPVEAPWLAPEADAWDRMTILRCPACGTS